MSATNSTVNYGLPQFLATDKPAWLTDFNGAMSDIDTAIKEAKTAGDNAQSTANTNTANIQTLDGTVTSQGTAIGSLQTAVAGNSGSINTINSLIGDGTPTTTNKTIIGAINEINSKVGDVEADDVSFDNTNTGLSATDVQAAIVEVKGLVATPDADDISYDNTDSGLSATNVQDAIDELAQGGGASYDLDLSAYSGDMTVTSNYTVSQSDSSVKYLMNADKSIAKIYGGLYITGSIATQANVWHTVATLSSTDMPTVATAYNIEIGYSQVSYGSGSISVAFTRLHFNTDGSIEVQISAGTVTNNNVAVNLTPCLYFLKDLGD